MFFLTAKAQSDKIKVVNPTSDYVKIIDVQNLGSWTEISLEFRPTTAINATLHPPTGKSPYVLSDRRGNRYALKNQVGWTGPNSGGYGTIRLNAGDRKVVKLFFDKLPKAKDIYSLTELGCETGCWNFYDIILKDDNYYLDVLSDSVDSNTYNEKKGRAKFSDTWIEKNVTNNSGEKGIRFHAKFNLYDLEGKELRMIVRLMNEDGTFVKTEKYGYRNASGQLSLYKKLKPKYKNTVYKDATVFLPFAILNLPRGDHKLKYDVDVIYPDGTLLKHFEITPFTYQSY
ncbi:hypothetical protein [Aquimarina brevivitae]|nr:hypothetical protein [Aquimarina brevivitae]